MTSWRQWILGASPDGGEPVYNEGWLFTEPANELISRLGDAWIDAEFQPTDADKRASSEFFGQLRSRIITRPLPYLDGEEKAALDSVHSLFACTRELSKSGGLEARRFSDIVWAFMNEDVRPVTAKWHRPFVKKRLGEDDRHDFREELESLQKKVVYYERVFDALSERRQITSPERIPPAACERGTSIPFDTILFSPSMKIVKLQKPEDEITGDRVMADETAAIQIRRGLSTGAEISDLAGLALSGGGLRSATFALGALQALARRGILANFDYMSTVSGGGYAGSFLTCILNSTVVQAAEPSRRENTFAETGPALDAARPTAAPNVKPKIGLGESDLPFVRSATQESAPMRHLRSSSKALLTGGFWKRLEIPVLALAGWLASLFVVFPPLVIFTLAICYFNQGAISRAFQGHEIYPDWWWEPFVIISTISIFACCLAVLTVMQHYRRKDGKTDLPETALQIVGFVFVIVLAMFAWWAFPVGPKLLKVIELWREDGVPIPPNSVVAALSAIAIPILSRLTKMTSKTSVWKPIFASIAFGILPLVFIWLVATLIARHILFVGDEHLLVTNRVWWLVAIAVIVVGLTHWFLNINACSLHPFYRDRLARAYHLKLDLNGNVVASSPQKLSELRDEAPYHIINASLNAPAGHDEALRGRTADFFVFSKLYCGSESTGYFPTKLVESTDPSVDLATAIAISGAAASPFMGVNSSRFNFWAALFNVRLDYWLQVPSRELRFWDGNPGPLYWLRQFIGDVRESYPYVNLSDGGHVENMGLYELLRRRCRYIVLVDGECDPGITCGSFLQVIRYAKIDFGIDIKIDLSRLKFADARAETESGTPTDATPTGKTASPTVGFHFALGRIEYGDGLAGLLLYLKSSVSGNEARSIESYREREAEFPHQSTADLAYDEEQFEAYRALGEHIVDDTFRKELVGTTPPTDVASWLHAIESRLSR